MFLQTYLYLFFFDLMWDAPMFFSFFFLTYFVINTIPFKINESYLCGFLPLKIVFN